MRWMKLFGDEVRRLAGAPSTNESTYYPATRTLLTEILTGHSLPFEVRTGTSEKRHGGGADQPDLAFYDRSGTVVVLSGEVKLPTQELVDMARSTERNDQIGRYLAGTRAVLLCNVRGFALVTMDSKKWSGSGPVPPSARHLELEVELWPSTSAMKQGKSVPDATVQELIELIEAATTRYASIVEPESLALILAHQARRAKADLPDKFGQAVQGLLDDFGKALGIAFEGPDGEEFFRSSLIQTAFYGLFAGWTLWWHEKRKEPFRWENLGQYLTIPFLGELFHEFQHPTRIKDLRLKPHLDMATDTLSRVIADQFFERFRGFPLSARVHEDGTAAPAAIMYFYEPFLEAFDPQLRKELGVWYTPPEIVQYQVAKVDRLLREELGCDRGFAEEKVVVLDPCCGTGAYLIEVARLVVAQLKQEGAGALLGEKVLQALCQRIIGFEILTAPFVISQLQLHLMLAELGTIPGESQRPAIFLTNALTGWTGPDQLKLNFPELQQEHDAVQQIKSEAKIIVILGNPPYNRFAGVPIAEEGDLVDHYKGIKRGHNGQQVGKSELFTTWGVRKHLLDDLYIRFFRLAERQIGERAEYGIVSFISNYSFYAGRSHPMMRESLLANFDQVWIDSLNGDKYKTGKIIPAGLPGERTTDQSVFTTEQDSRGIQVGTGITTLVKLLHHAKSAPGVVVHHREFWGRADAKRGALLASLQLESWPEDKKTATTNRPEGPRAYAVLQPTSSAGWRLVPQHRSGGFEDWPALDELFPTAFQGVNPNRGLEGSLIETDKEAIEARMQAYFSDDSWSELERQHPVICEARARYDPRKTRERLKKISSYRLENVVPYLVFPFDLRWIYYEEQAKLLNERWPDLWENREDNEFLVAVPQARRISETRPMIARCLFDLHLHDRGSVGFPAEVKPKQDLLSYGSPLERSANISDELWTALSQVWKLKGDRRGAAAKTVTRKLFRIGLAICHSPAYETEHKENLSQDWAHVPLPRDRDVFEEGAALGEKLAILLEPRMDARITIKQVLGAAGPHLGEVQRVGGGSVKAKDLVVTYSYYGSAQGSWRERLPTSKETWRSCWGEKTGDLFLNDQVFLKHVPERVWRYELGGYPVVKKWLGGRDAGRRAGRPLSVGEVEQLQGMVRRLAAILTLHEHLDQLYERAAAGAFSIDELGVR